MEWWKHDATVPATLGHAANFTLYPAELQQYYDALTLLKQAVDAEHAAAARSLLAAERGRVPAIVDAPRLFTLTHMLKLMVRTSEGHLAVQRLLVDLLQRRKRHV